MAAPTTLAKLDLKVTVDNKEIKSALKRTQKEIASLRNASRKNTNAISSGFSNMGKSVLRAGAAFLTFRAASKIITSSIKTIANFEKAMSDVEAITGATGQELKRLEGDALRLGSTTSKTATEVAGLQKEFAKLGFSTDEILAATEATINLSIAAGSDLAESAVVAASTVRAFGLTAEDTGRVTDVMARSFSRSSLDMEKFKTAIASVAPVAKNAGFTLEETTALLSVLADNGIDASTSGTALRNIFLDIAQEGISLDEALARINNGTVKNVESLKQFGKRGATVATVIAENIDKTGKLTKVYNDSAGAAKDMADVMEDNLEGDVKKLSSAWEGLILQQKSASGSFRIGVQAATALTQGLTFLTGAGKKHSKQLREEQTDLNVLLGKINDVNVSEEDRLGLIEDLNKNYPGFLGNLDEEKVTNEELNKRLIEVNDQYRIRITLTKSQEDVDKQGRKFARKDNRALNQKIKLQNNLATVGASLGISTKLLGKTELQQIQIIKNALNETQKSSKAKKAAGQIIGTLQRQYTTLTVLQIDAKNKEEDLTEAEEAHAKKTEILTGQLENLGEIVNQVDAAEEEAAEAAKKRAAAEQATAEQKRKSKQEEADLEEKLRKEKKKFDDEDKAMASSLAAFERSEKEKTFAGRRKLLQEDFENRKIGEKQLLGELKNLAAEETAFNIDQDAKEAKSAQDLADKKDEIDKELRDKIRERREEQIQIAEDISAASIEALANLFEASKNRELKAAGDNEKKKEAIEKKFAKKQQAVAVMQAIINGALGITKGFAQLGPIGGAISAALIAATTATQIGVITSQPLAMGGIATSPTLATVGDNPNARTDGEAILPISKLQDLIDFNSGNQGGEFVFKIRGRELVAMIEKQKKMDRVF